MSYARRLFKTQRGVRSSVEIGDVASPHWQRGHMLHPISAVYWVGQMGAGGLWR
jgi:hypothetical protein